MSKKFLPALAVSLLASLAQIHADGFIVIHEPTRVPPGHYPFVPLEVSRHRVGVRIDNQIATTSVDEEFYNPNNQRLEGTYLFPVPKDARLPVAGNGRGQSGIEQRRRRMVGLQE